MRFLLVKNCEWRHCCSRTWLQLLYSNLLAWPKHFYRIEGVSDKLGEGRCLLVNLDLSRLMLLSIFRSLIEQFKTNYLGCWEISIDWENQVMFCWWMCSVVLNIVKKLEIWLILLLYCLKSESSGGYILKGLMLIIKARVCFILWYCLLYQDGKHDCVKVKALWRGHKEIPHLYNHIYMVWSLFVKWLS